MKPSLLVLEDSSYWFPECQLAFGPAVDVATRPLDRAAITELSRSRPSLLLADLSGRESGETPLTPHLVRGLLDGGAPLIAIISGHSPTPSAASAPADEWWLRELRVAAVFADDVPRETVMGACRRILFPAG